MTTISIPAECVPILRSALLSLIGTPAGRIELASVGRNKEKHPERFLEPLAEIDEHRAILEVLGWADPAVREPVSLDLDAHRGVVSRSLHTRLDVERDYMALHRREARRRRSALGSLHQHDGGPARRDLGGRCRA
jgi:hypothetical protein